MKRRKKRGRRERGGGGRGKGKGRKEEGKEEGINQHVTREKKHKLVNERRESGKRRK